MATHRRGLSAAQWPVRDLLRREGRPWPSLSPAARGLAVGGALVCSTVVAVSMAAEPEDPAPTPAPDPLSPPAAAPEPEAPDLPALALPSAESDAGEPSTLQAEPEPSRVAPLVREPDHGSADDSPVHGTAELRAMVRETAAVSVGRFLGYRRLMNLDDTVRNPGG